MVSRRDLRMLGVGFLLAAGLLLGRLVQMQVVGAEVYRRRAREARKVLEWLPTLRGRILDRNGRVLADSTPTWSLVVHLPTIDPRIHLNYRLHRATGLRREALDVRFGRLEQTVGSTPWVGFIEGLDEEAAARCRRLTDRFYEGQIRLRSTASGYALDLARDLVTRRLRVVDRLATLLGDTTRETMLRRLDDLREEALASPRLAVRRRHLARRHPLRTRLEFDRAARLAEQASELSGCTVRRQFCRRYPERDLAPHVIGTLGALRPSEADRLQEEEALLIGGARSFDLDRFLAVREKAHFLDDELGRSGLEARFEEELAGEHGVRLWYERERGGEREPWVVIPPQAGSDLRLTLDADIQRAAERALDEALASHPGNSGGAAVLLDVRTGAILACASAPRYDLNRYRELFEELREARPSPLRHRAVGSLAPPGSTFKLLVAAAGLTMKTPVPDGRGLPPRSLTLASRLTCTGQMGSGHFRCHVFPGRHGPIGVHDAIKVSCNHYFYKLGQAMGPEGLVAWARMAGFGRSTGCGLPGEAEGLIPSPRWKQNRYLRALRRWKKLLLQTLNGEVEYGSPEVIRAADWLRRTEQDRHWWGGDSRNTAIGQGGLLVTPLQVARMAAIFGNGGVLVQPHLVEGDRQPAWRLGIPEPVLEAVQEGMRRVVHDAGGTASSDAIGLAECRAAAKTGTAQAGPRGDHAWICGYAPFDRPRVAFAVLIEHADDHGGSAAGPVAAAVLRAWEEAGEDGR